MILKNIFFELMNNTIFGKTMENMRKNKDFKLVITERSGICGQFELYSFMFSYYKVFHRTSISNRNEKEIEIFMNKPVYWRFSILELSKILMYEFWYDYVKPKYGEKKQNCVTLIQAVSLYT